MTRGEQPTLTGTKVVLRPFALEDVGAIYEACQDPEIQLRTTVPSPYAYEDAVHYVTVAAPEAWASGGALFAVIDTRTGELAGAMGFHRVRGREAEIGYWTSPSVRGRGLTSDALRAVTRWFLREDHADSMIAAVEPVNENSSRVALAAGYVWDRVEYRDVPSRGRTDVVLDVYSISAADLPADGEWR